MPPGAPAMDAVAAADLAEPMSALEGEGATPRLELVGFSGQLALLLTLARAHQVDLRACPWWTS